ncbi:MAG: tetratricopeptide repeat protein [Proteobacteria bacterium]|nr:tetratricopeptide repeat protein [Pseudomonadota bacterium]
MTDFLDRLKQRKLVQWALAYLAAAWVLLQVLGLAADSYDWPHAIMRIAFGVIALGFVVTLLLAWYHGERGAQRVSGAELLLIALVLVIGGGLLWRFGKTPAPTATTDVVAAHKLTAAISIPSKSIAVLPFENLSSDKENDYFVAGMQDLILTKLADIGELKVISRTSTLKYRSRPENLKQVGAELGVANVLEGSVQRQGNAVLVNVQLIDTATDAHLWAESYQRTLDNVFGVEGEVAGKVADALQAKLSPESVGRLATSLSNNPEADDLYLRAEFSSHRGDIDFDTSQYKQAIVLYREAIAKAPDFALALARLSYADNALAWLGGGGEDVAHLVADAQARAESALKLAPRMPEARLAMGYNHYYGKGEYSAALADFVAVLRLRPNDAKALIAQGLVLRRQGHFDAALDSLRHAQTLDPRNSELGLSLGETLMMVSRFADAKVALQRALALDPANLQARFRLSCVILFARGDIAGALQAARGDEPRMRLWRVNLLGLQAKYPQALALLDAVPDTPDNFYQAGDGPKLLQQAELHLSLGDTARARELFAQALPIVRERLDTTSGIPIKAVQVRIWIAQAEYGVGDIDKSMASLAEARALLAQARDSSDGPSLLESIAAAYARAGSADAAVSALAQALATPGIGVNYSPAMLWIDPAWNPMRESPGFQALLQKYADAKPDQDTGIHD